MMNKEKALQKMLKEMEGNHPATIHGIHNWLCDQEDEELFEGILTDGKTIKGAMDFCYKKAKEQSNGASSVMIDDKTVFGWVVNYFKAEEKVANKKTDSKAINVTETEECKDEKTELIDVTKEEVKESENPFRKVEEQITLFDFI